MSCVKPAAVGGFVLGGLAIVVAAVLFFGGGDMFSTKTKAVVFFEGSVGGLTAGAPVTFDGVRVGTVSKVALVVDPSNLRAEIPVYLELEPDQVTLPKGSVRRPMLRRLIAAGLRAKLVSQSLVTGQMLVELDFSPTTPAHLVGAADPNVPEIPAMQSDLQEFTQQLTQAPIAQTVAQAQRTLVAIEKVANRIDNEIGPLTGSTQHLLDSASRTMDEAHSLAADGRQQLDARGAELSRTLVTAQKTLQSVNELADSANSLVAPRSRSRSDLEATLRDLSASASALRDLTQTLDRDPSVAVLGRRSR